MGTNFSSFAMLETNGNYTTSTRSQVGSNPGLGDLPENCVSLILSHLDPPEICRLAVLSRTFRGASSDDLVWESKLPSNYKNLVDKVLQGLSIIPSSSHPNHHYVPKKEIYSKLCQPNRFDNGTKEVWLDKKSGKVFLSISSKALRITGIDDRRYWNYIPTEESRFERIAYLQQIWWVEVLGELEFEFPAGSYSLYFRLQLGKASRRFGRRVCNVDQVHGWDIKPVRFQLSTSNGQKSVTEFYLNEPGNWFHYHVGDFVVEKTSSTNVNDDVAFKIKFSMVQIDCTHTKGGLCLDSVFIYPTEFCPKQ